MFRWVDVDTFTTQDHEDSGEFNIQLNDFISSLGKEEIPKKSKKKEKVLETPVTEMFEDSDEGNLNDLLTDVLSEDDQDE
jgi:hypothetical protein